MFFFSGICLPKRIQDLFIAPIQAGLKNKMNRHDNIFIENKNSQCVENITELIPENTYTKMPNVTDALKEKLCNKKSIFLNHSKEECISCIRKKFKRVTSKIITSNQLTSETLVDFETSPSILKGNNKSLILRHVKHIANPIWSKRSKQKLLELKQQSPDSFQDLCLYSEVSKILGKTVYRSSSRRFIQEIFYDLDFKIFYEDFLYSGNLIDLQTDLSLIAENFPEPSENYFFNMLGTKQQQKFSRNYLKEAEIQAYMNDSNHINTCEQKIKDEKMLTSLSSTSSLKSKNYSRPRFHTLELDLSCTKNKFPIRSRSKPQNNQEIDLKIELPPFAASIDTHTVKSSQSEQSLVVRK